MAEKMFISCFFLVEENERGNQRTTEDYLIGLKYLNSPCPYQLEKFSSQCPLCLCGRGNRFFVLLLKKINIMNFVQH